MVLPEKAATRPSRPVRTPGIARDSRADRPRGSAPRSRPDRPPTGSGERCARPPYRARACRVRVDRAFEYREEVRPPAIQRVADHPRILGTNAAPSVGFGPSEVGGTMTEVLAGGTALVEGADTVPAQPVAVP